MTWTRLSDTFNDDPQLLQVSRSARLLHVEALVYCNKHLLDGALPAAALRRITDSDDSALDVAQLVDAEVWSATEGGWQLPWDSQEPAERVRSRQERRREIQQAYRDRKAAQRPSGDSRVTGNATGNETASRPVPTRPAPKGAGRDREQSSTGDCSVCSRPEAECRARSHVSGHDFTPRAAAGVRVVPTDSEPREAASR